MNHLRQIGVLALLVLICLGAYWEIATFQNSLKWDMLDCYFPWRFIVGESIQHRIFPFWNPYQHLGYPIHADMRSVYYPEAMLVGLLGGYNLKVMHFLFMFYISMAGLGMYRLIGQFSKRESAKVLGAISYVLCGFFVGHGQEMFGIIAATWIPWVFTYFLQFLRTSTWSDLWKLLFFLFLQLTGGYQALSLILFYLLVVLGTVILTNRIKEKGWSSVRGLIGKSVFMGGLLLASLAMLIVTYAQVSPYVDRLTGLSLQDSYFGSLTPQALISIIAPFSVVSDAPLLGTDISMANVYVGIIMLALFLVGTFLRKTALLWVFWVFGFICLLASLGPSTPVREFLYDFVPGMNLFRMSSFFSYFSQLGLILIGSVAFDRILSQPESGRKWLLRGSLFVFLGALVLAIITLLDKAAGPNMSFGVLFLPESYLPKASYHHRLFVHAAIQSLLLLVFILALVLSRKRSQFISPIVFAFVLVEMFVSVRLNFSSTVGDTTPPAQTQAKLDKQPKGFTMPSLKEPIVVNGENKPEISPLYHNTNIFTKTLSWDGFNSFRLERFERFKREHEADYLSDRENPILFATSPANIRMTEYAPDDIQCSVTSTAQTDVVLQQIYYPGWEVLVDGTLAELKIHHEAFPSVTVPAGTHTVSFRYENRAVKVGFYLSYGLFILIVIACVFHLFRTYASSGRSLVGTTVVVLACGIFLGFQWSKTETMASRRAEGYQRLSTLLNEQLSSGHRLFLQVEKPEMMDSVLNSVGVSTNAAFINGRTPVGQSELLTALGTDSSASRLIYAGSMLPADETTLAYLRAHFTLESFTEVGREFIHVFSKNPPSEKVFHTLNDFEGSNAVWNYDFARADSAAQAFSGRFGWRIHTQEMGSPGLTVRVGDVTDETHPTLLFGLKALVPTESASNALLWMVAERDGEQLWTHAKNIKPSAPDAEHWFETVLVVKPDAELKPDDTIKVFVWGGEGDALHIDDTWFALYPAK